MAVLVLYLEGSRGINVALILIILLNNNQASNDLHIYKDRNDTSATFKPVLNWANVCLPEHTSDTSTNYDSFLN